MHLDRDIHLTTRAVSLPMAQALKKEASRCFLQYPETLTVRISGEKNRYTEHEETAMPFTTRTWVSEWVRVDGWTESVGGEDVMEEVLVAWQWWQNKVTHCAHDYSMCMPCAKEVTTRGAKTWHTNPIYLNSETEDARGLDCSWPLLDHLLLLELVHAVWAKLVSQ